MISPRRRRSLGQHFLRNLAAASQIVSWFAPREGEVVLEIGPGHGVLTERLLAAGARVLAIEKDAEVAATLSARLGGSDRLHVVVGDALDAPIASLLRGLDASPTARFRLLANLPYSVGTEIVSRALLASPLFSSLTVMLQREVAARIAAEPGGRTYGSLSVLSQYYAAPRIVMRLTPGSFAPPPKVDSAVVVMPIREERELAGEIESGYAPFIRSLFRQKRRTLPHNLVPAAGRDLREAAARLTSIGIDPGRRPETLTRAECLRIYSDIIAHQ